jgi:hypothetical protein
MASLGTCRSLLPRIAAGAACVAGRHCGDFGDFGEFGDFGDIGEGSAAAWRWHRHHVRV